MKAGKLVWQRLRQNIHFQIESIRLGIDWTVLVYLLIPFVICLVAVYHSWWVATPEWMAVIPFHFLLFFFYIFAWTGSIRLFIAEGDQLFLLQKRTFYLSLRCWSLGYSLGKTVFVSILLFVIFIPYFSLHSFHFGEVVRILFLFILWKTLFLLIKEITVLMTPRIFIRFLINYGLFGGGYLLFFASFSSVQTVIYWLFVICLLAGITYLFWKKVHVHGHFEMEVERDQRVKFRMARLFLVQGGAIEQQSGRKHRKRPLLFRTSKHWFNNRRFPNVATEYFLKAWLRKPQNIFSYLRFLTIAVVALAIFPAGLNSLVFVFILFIFYQMIRAEWHQFARILFIRLIVRDETKYEHARERIEAFLLAPGYIILFIVQLFTGASRFITSIIVLVALIFLLKPWLRKENQHESSSS